MKFDLSACNEQLRGLEPLTIAVAVADDHEVLEAVLSATRAGWVKALLFGKRDNIIAVAQTHNLDLIDCTIVECRDEVDACQQAVKAVREDRADFLMKGLVDTATILRAVLNSETGIKQASLLSHVGIFEVPFSDKLLFVTDAAMNIAPNLTQKQGIVENAVALAHSLGIAKPIVACVCAVEKVNPKMVATTDAAALVELNQTGIITGCTVAGPFALDNACFEEAAKHKGITDPAAGHADILLMPQIESGNVLHKALSLMLKANGAGLVLGAKCPVVLTSRADSSDVKLNSIMLAACMCHGQKEHV